jgi:hypothetical protein
MIPNLNLSEEEKAEVKASLKRTSNAKKRYRIYPYKFKDVDITKKEVTVTQIVDDTTFYTKEFPDNPIRLAGINLRKTAHPDDYQKAKAEISSLIQYGNKITIGIDANPNSRIKNDTLNTIGAAVYYTEGEKKGRTLQRSLLSQGNKAVEEKENDYSAASTHARFGSDEIAFGSLWESFAHLDTPFHNKFLQVRSPVEMYERKEVYGKSFQSWSSPIEGIVQPTLESLAHKTPIVAMLHTALIGTLVGAGMKKTAVGGFIVGALLGGTMSSTRVFTETITGETWIPARRRKEREINEYFDRLKYLKYKGLYEKARQEAIAREGVDVAEIIKARDTQKRENKRDKQMLAGFKKWLKMDQSTESKRLIKQSNQELNAISEGNALLQLGPYSMLALNYEMKARSTIYGLDAGSDVSTIYGALPPKEREFYQYFMNAKGAERDKILKLIPKNERKFFASKWGVKAEKEPTMEEYFKKHGLPSASWAGWSAKVNLDDVKIKVIKNEALDLTEFGFWQDDEKYAALAPKADMNNRTISSSAIRQRLHSVLKGQGLKDIDINISRTPSNEPKMNIAFNLFHDAKQDFKDVLNDTTAFTLM